MPRIRIITAIAWVFCVLVCVWSLYATISLAAASQDDGRIILLIAKIVEKLLPVFFVIPAMLIIRRQPRNTIGWLLMFILFVAVTSDATASYLASFQASPPPATFLILFITWFTNAAWAGAIFPLLVLPVIFPTGRPFTQSWRLVICLAAIMGLIFLVYSIFQKTFQVEFASWTLVNPIGIAPNSIDKYFVPLWGVLLFVLTVASMSSIILRFRRSSGIEREQVKWLLYATSIFGLIYILGLFLNTPETTTQSKILSDLNSLLLNLAAMTIPLAIGIALLRYRLYDINVIIRLTLVYAMLTGLLGFVYAGGIILLQAGFRLLTGQTSEAAIVVTTLGIVVLFNPLRLHVQDMINRRFFRQRYNAEHALAEFAAAARKVSDVDRLTAMLEEMVQANLQPTRVSVELKTWGEGTEEK